MRTAGEVRSARCGRRGASGAPAGAMQPRECGWRGVGALNRAPAGQRQCQAAEAAARSADSIVLISSIVIVIGPTPPGTGVM